MHRANKAVTTTRRILVSTISTALLIPLTSLADHGQQVADGTTLVLAPDNYTTSGQTTLLVRNAGSMIAAGGSVVTASGNNASGAQINGAGSTLTFLGGSLSTNGQFGYGVYALAGSSVTIGRDPGGIGTAINTTGNQAYGLYATNAGTIINGTAVTIGTSGIGSYGARIGAAHVLLTDSTIATTGDYAYGIYVDAASFTPANGTVTLNNVAVSTQGLTAYAIYLDGSQGKATANITGSSLTTSGRESSGILLMQGAQAAVSDTSVQTTGDFAYGVDVNQNGSQITLDRVSLTTTGDYADAVWAPSNSMITAKDFTIHTSGDVALGIDNRGSAITLTNGSILTDGTSAYALYASRELASDTLIAGENLDILTRGAGGTGAFARLGGYISLDNSSITTTGDVGIGVRASSGSAISLTDTSIDTLGAQSYGAYVYGNVDMIDGHIHTSGSDAYGLFILDGGQVNLGNVSLLTEGDGAYGAVVGYAIGGAGGSLDMDGGSLTSQQAEAFHVLGNSSIHVSNDAQVVGGNGVLMNVADSTGQITLSMDNHVDAQGDIVFASPLLEDAIPEANTSVSLDHGSQWTGATQHAVNQLSLDNGSLWSVTDNSSIGQLVLNNAAIQFAAPSDNGYKTLVVNGNLSGAGGVVSMNTLLNEGGALSQQQTDRILILGDVTTASTTLLDVTPQGNGAATGTSTDGIAGPGEGISLVQVAGNSRADAFALKYGYVAVGPWKYTLSAFGPGHTDPAQNALPTGTLNWDYRLASAYIEIPGDGNQPPGEDNAPPKDDKTPGEDNNPPSDDSTPPDNAHDDDPTGTGDSKIPVRRALVPQVPSYIVAPTALLNYGDTIADTLHQRLGEIRDVTPSTPFGGELFVRYIGSRQRYASNLSAGDYGYGFDQQTNAWQLGGSLVSWTDSQSSLRAGWAFDKGNTRVTPDAPDGYSVGRYRAHGASAWLTWQQANGFYLDGVLSNERYQGEIGTQARNGAVADLRANGWVASVEAGYPFALGDGWSVEPQVQLKRQSLTFLPFADTDGLYTQINVGGLTTTRLGTRVANTSNPRFAPYVRADVIHTTGGGSHISTSSQAWGAEGVFDGGRLGNSYRLGAGATSQLTPQLALYGDADYLHGTDGYGFRGWQANLGLRFNF
jgi:outer membrane autotransporter protein